MSHILYGLNGKRGESMVMHGGFVARMVRILLMVMGN